MNQLILDNLGTALTFLLGGGWIVTWYTLKQKNRGLTIDNDTKAIANMVVVMNAMQNQITQNEREYALLKQEMDAKCAELTSEIAILKKKLNNLN